MGQEYSYRSAFCLMKYSTVDGLETEWLWNSRDGVTPFCITNRDLTREMRHVDWHRDMRLPNYQPAEGQRIFVDMTPEIAVPLIKARIERWWEHHRFPMSNTYDSKKEAEQSLLAEWCKPGAPAIVVFGADAI